MSLFFRPLSAIERAYTKNGDGEHIGRLLTGDLETMWHVYRHRDGILVCWEYVNWNDPKVDPAHDPMRIVTNTTDVNELHRFLPK